MIDHLWDWTSNLRGLGREILSLDLIDIAKDWNFVLICGWDRNVHKHIGYSIKVMLIAICEFKYYIGIWGLIH